MIRIHLSCSAGYNSTLLAAAAAACRTAGLAHRTPCSSPSLVILLLHIHCCATAEAGSFGGDQNHFHELCIGPVIKILSYGGWVLWWVDHWAELARTRWGLVLVCFRDLRVSKTRGTGAWARGPRALRRAKRSWVSLDSLAVGSGWSTDPADQRDESLSCTPHPHAWSDLWLRLYYCIIRKEIVVRG
jgi:hypothetical protein